MAQYIKQGNIFGRLGTGLGQGISEQLPKEVERTRLSQGLKALGQKQGLSPFESFSELAAIPGVANNPQLLQSFSDLLRQKSLLDSIKQSQGESQQNEKIPQDLAYLRSQKSQPEGIPPSPTTVEGVQSTLNPYIPRSGKEKEDAVKELYATQPLIYNTLDAARQAIDREEAANIARSNAMIESRKLQQDVKNKAEEELSKEILRLGAQIPGNALSKLQTEALEAVRDGKMTEDQAGKVFGEKADEMSRIFENVRSWGGPTLFTKDAKSLGSAIKSTTKFFDNLGSAYKRDFADTMIAENDLSPEYSYHLANLASEDKALAQAKKLPSLGNFLSKAKGYGGAIGLGGVIAPLVKSADTKKKTLEIAPSLAKSMGKDSSPLAIAYELEKKGYDPQVWKDYLIERQNELLTPSQIDELGKSKSAFMGWLNDWFLKSFSGLE